MKCPKCGYNSFEFYDSCKKCANDLTGYKETYGIKAIVLPLEARAGMAATLMAETALNEPAPVANDEHVDMFSFDVPKEEETTSSSSDDPFDFDDEIASPSQTGGSFSFDDGQKSTLAQNEEDAFSDLLESTSQEDRAPMATVTGFAASSSGESDLSNFSWDDTPAASPDEPAKPVEDNFDSLFGELDDIAKK